MTDKKTLEEDLKAAMRAKDALVKRTLRGVLSAVKLEEVDKGKEINEEELIPILQREVKTRRESISDAQAAGREDIIREAEAEITVLEKYLPEPLTEGQLRALVEEAIEETGATDPQEMGKVMGAVMPKVQGRAEGKEVSQMVRSMLSDDPQ